MKISEIFYSIQGEGVYQGIPMVFVRLQGCNLIPHCNWCDTVYAQDGSKGEEWSIQDIVAKVSELLPYYKSWVCITGGEPLWQPNELEQLVKELKKGGYLVTIETNGSFPVPSWYTLAESWSTDIKCPSSGVCGVSKEDWFYTRYKDQIKFVVGSKEDLEFAQKVLDRHKANNPIILVSPVIETCPPGGLSKWYEVWNNVLARQVIEFCKDNRVRFSLQWHKVVWGDKRGV